MRSRQPLTTLVATGSLLALTACGGGSDGDSSSDGDAVSESGGGTDVAPVELTTKAGEVEVLSSGGTLLPYTVDLPAAFEITEFSTSINPTWEDPTAEFADRSTRVSVLATPVAATADDLVTSFQTVNSSITVLDSVDEPGGFSWFTYTTPSVSGDDTIAFGSAQSARALSDGTSLQCTAATQVALEEEWSEADAIAVANEMLAICTSVMGG